MKNIVKIGFKLAIASGKELQSKREDAFVLFILNIRSWGGNGQLWKQRLIKTISNLSL